jgi:hypothetical protein
MPISGKPEIGATFPENALIIRAVDVSARRRRTTLFLHFLASGLHC